MCEAQPHNPSIVDLLRENAALRQDIETRKRREADVQAQVEYYRTVAEYTYDWEYWRGSDGTFRYVSPSCERVTGYPAAEFFRDASLLERILHPDDRDRIARHIMQSSENSCEVSMQDFRIITRTGEIRWIGHICQPVYTADGRYAGRRASNRDITDRKRAEDIMWEKVAELERFFTCALDLLCIANTDGYFLRLNREWEKVLGFSLDELEGARFLDFVHPNDLSATLSALSKLETQHEVPNFTNRYRCKDGGYRWIEWRSSPYGTLIYASARDITAQKHAEEALHHSYAQLRELTARIAETEENERRRLARELHDQVGQTLTALNLNLTIIQGQLPGDTPAKVRIRLTDTQQLVEETTRIIRSIMTELRPAVLDDYGVFAALRWYAEQFARRTNIVVNVRGKELEQRLASSVETALFRITQEALTNILKHAQATEATVMLEMVDVNLVLTIQDNGIGFEPTALSPHGLGLAAMRERAMAIGGQFTLHTSPHQGTGIVVSVPYRTNVTEEAQT